MPAASSPIGRLDLNHTLHNILRTSKHVNYSHSLLKYSIVKVTDKNSKSEADKSHITRIHGFLSVDGGSWMVRGDRRIYVYIWHRYTLAHRVHLLAISQLKKLSLLSRTMGTENSTPVHSVGSPHATVIDDRDNTLVLLEKMRKK